jgi:O-methyltransferase involved in polyketide biosynthesis
VAIFSPHSNSPRPLAKRPNALWRDPFAERLAGARGVKIANTLPTGNKQEWAWVARTYLFEKFIAQAVSEGCGPCCRNELSELDY